MKGIVFNIQKFCVNDGPGIRTTVFLKGCPLRCKWCHNPESYIKNPQLCYEDFKCVKCGKCVSVCPQKCHWFDENGVHHIDREKCIACGKCVSECMAQALKITGKSMTAEEVIEKVLQDKIFYETSGGGLTISGGEPFFQPDFTLELLKLAKREKIHTCVETSGCVDFKNISKCLPYIDLLLWDIKETDPILHKEYTGGDFNLVLENLKKVCEKKIPIILRRPIIPKHNDRIENENFIENLIKTNDNIISVQKMPYHNLGIHKSVSHGMKKQKDYSI